jgi:hypothetical protein
VCLKLPCALSSRLEEGEIILELVQQKILDAAGVKKEMVAAQWRHSLTKLLPCILYSNRAARTTKRGAALNVNPETVGSCCHQHTACAKRKFHSFSVKWSNFFRNLP